MDHFEIDSRPGAGTTGDRPEARGMMRVSAGSVLSARSATEKGRQATPGLVDSWARGVLVAVADGLGHGPAAAAAARAFVERVRSSRARRSPS